MAATNPTLSVGLTGAENVTTLDKEIAWTSESKLEQTYVINNGDGAQTIDLSNIDNLKVMMFVSTSAFQVSFTVAGDTIAFEVNNILVLDPSTTFSGSITSLTLSTQSASDITVAVRIYGESS